MCQSMGLLQQKLNEAVFWVRCAFYIYFRNISGKIFYQSNIYVVPLGEEQVFILTEQHEERLET